MTTNDPQSVNMGSRLTPKLRMVDFPNADEIVRNGLLNAPRSEEAVDIMLVNPPTPDGELWIRTQHRVGSVRVRTWFGPRFRWRKWPPYCTPSTR